MITTMYIFCIVSLLITWHLVNDNTKRKTKLLKIKLVKTMKYNSIVIHNLNNTIIDQQEKIVILTIELNKARERVFTIHNENVDLITKVNDINRLAQQVKDIMIQKE